MLDIGFKPQIRKIVEQMDMGVRQTMLFSCYLSKRDPGLVYLFVNHFFMFHLLPFEVRFVLPTHNERYVRSVANAIVKNEKVDT